MLKWFALLLVLLASSAAAEEATRCRIEVAGTSYLDAPCEFEASNGTITIGVGAESSARHFAYIVDGIAYWNGATASAKADTLLGSVVKDGACWLNAAAKLCVEGVGVLDLMAN